MLRDSPPTRFFLLLPDRSKVELHCIVSSTGSDDRKYYLILDDDYERLRNEAMKRIEPLGVEPTSVKDTNS